MFGLAPTACSDRRPPGGQHEVCRGEDFVLAPEQLCIGVWHGDNLEQIATHSETGARDRYKAQLTVFSPTIT